MRSTAAIEAGRYKTVNTAAAAVIAAIANALGDEDFPFVFGGDGASFALPPDDADLGRARARRGRRLGAGRSRPDMRVALVPVAAVRAAGLDVRIARFAPSPDVSYAMFTGGGLAWAERQMKAGAFAIDAGAAGHAAGPDGPLLPLRRDPRRARRHPLADRRAGRAGRRGGFRDAVAAVLALAESGADAGARFRPAARRSAGRRPGSPSRRRRACGRSPVAPR